MTGRARALVRAAVVVALGLLAFGLWLWEVLKVKGWPGLAWLNGYPYSAIGVAALVAVASSRSVSSLRSMATPTTFTQ
jgi:hypothetical protein